ncbi:MAG TPA: antibiotic biosynthesis monooxygenase [Anaerolineales bacterium]|nr:antibiotic biosynthesis monooxygenase [Anaerolineales bacterium]
MYVILWEYEVKADRLAEFEEIYAANGAWTKLFKKSTGFHNTELLRNENYHHRYITIDRWASSGDYESFRLQWKTEYKRLDSQCEGLTEQETLLGQWESIFLETR